MPFMTSTQIAAHIGFSERSVQRQLLLPEGHKKRIYAEKYIDGRWNISDEELARLTPGSQSAELLAKYEELIKEVNFLKNEILLLKGEIALLNSRLTTEVINRREQEQGTTEREVDTLLASWPAIDTPKPEPEPELISAEIEYTSPDQLPPGSLSLAEFCERHRVVRRSVQGQLDNIRYQETHNLTHVKFPTNRVGEYSRFVTPKQQEKLITCWRTTGFKFTP